MVEDTYQPLTRLMPAGYSSALLDGIDAGLKVRARDRPPSIADWRSMLAPPRGI